MIRTSECSKKYLGFDDKWALLIGIPVLSFAIPVLFFGESPVSDLSSFLPRWITSFLYTSSYWLSCRSIFIFVRKKFPSYQHIGWRILIATGLILVAFVLINIIIEPIDSYICGEDSDFDRSHLEYIVPSLTIIALISSIYESIFLYQQLKKSIQEKEELKRENIQSQLEGLKSQVNPHFLFNSLNTLTYLIPEDSERAVEFVRKLSQTYRYILEIRDKKLVSLREELDFLDAYLFLLKERFGDNLRISIEIDPVHLDRQMISLSLQLLIENAIKHNIISAGKPLFIKLHISEQGHLIIQNNLQKKKQSMPSTGTGLQNIRNRYRFFSDEEVEVITTAQHFIVSLPLLEAQKETSLT
jgi:two-component system LytT family sensor kinase